MKLLMNLMVNLRLNSSSRILVFEYRPPAAWARCQRAVSFVWMSPMTLTPSPILSASARVLVARSLFRRTIFFCNRGINQAWIG